MSQLTEDEALAVLRGAFDRPVAHVALGIGDDCAVLRPLAGALVWTVDACLEGVHFRFDWMSIEDVAWRSFHAAVSDVAAMGATPVGALCQVTLARGLSRSQLEHFARAQAEAAASLRCPIIGGNLTSAEGFEVVTTVLGQAGPSGVLGRAGAQVGDEIWLFGSAGHARAGLLCLERGRGARGALAKCVAAFRRPRALVKEGARLRERATACLDVSDGLARDAGQLASQSGVALVFDEVALLGDVVLRRAAELLGEDPLGLALQGGEDYALLATGPRRLRPRGVRVLGRVAAGEGVFVETSTGRRPVTGGFEHRSAGRRRGR